ncbi:MAG: amidohydrolase family protein [Acidimicrobiia bacterium]|nr:amidohydrolase family protein [Acidimicrobiia bacterium]
MRVVDIHAHLVPIGLVKRAQSGSIRGVEVRQHGEHEYSFHLEGSDPTRSLPPKLIDTGARESWMDEQGIDVQVVGTWADLFGYELPPELATEWAQHLNNTMLEVTSDSPHYEALASLPMQVPGKAAEMIPMVLAEGFVGVTIATRIGATELDAPELEPFWHALSDCQAAVFIHPGYSDDDPRTADYGLINAVGRPVDTTIALARLLAAGIPTRFPGARIILAHGGGALPFILGRLGRNYELFPDLSDPRSGTSHLYFDSVVFDPDALCFLVEKAAPDAVMLGSDYPFPIGDHTPKKVLERAERLTETQQAAILGHTASKLLEIRTN